MVKLKLNTNNLTKKPGPKRRRMKTTESGSSRPQREKSKPRRWVPLWSRVKEQLKDSQKQYDDYNQMLRRIENAEPKSSICIHSPLREDEHPSFVIYPDSEDDPGRFEDKARPGVEGTMADLARKLNIDPKVSGPANSQRRAELTLEEFARQRALNRETLKTFGVTETVLDNRPALQYPTPLGIDRVKFLDGAEPKYRWVQRGGRAHWYGLERYTGGVLYVVNGEPSVWAAHQGGVAAVCLCAGEGTVPNGTLVEELREKGVEHVRVVYDRDQAGYTGALKVRDALRESGIEAEALHLPEHLGKGADLDDLHRAVGDTKLAQVLEDLEPMKDDPVLRLQAIVRELAKAPDARACIKLQREAVETLANIPDDLNRRMAASYLSAHTRNRGILPARDLFEHASREEQRRRISRQSEKEGTFFEVKGPDDLPEAMHPANASAAELLLLPGTCSLLVGRAGVGKSTLLRHLIGHVAFGLQCLDLQQKPGSVLFFELEDGDQQTAQALREVVRRPALDGHRLRVVTQLSAAWKDELLEHILKVKPRYVFLNSAAMLLHLESLRVGRDLSENDSQFSHIVLDLISIVRDYPRLTDGRQLSMVLTHHTPRSDDSRARGHSGIDAAVDSIVLLKFPDSSGSSGGGTQRILEPGKSRVIPNVDTMLYERSGRTASVDHLRLIERRRGSAKSSPPDGSSSDEIKRQIVRYCLKEGFTSVSPATQREIKAGVSGRNQRIAEILKKMVKNNERVSLDGSSYVMRATGSDKRPKYFLEKLPASQGAVSSDASSPSTSSMSEGNPIR